MPNRSRCAAADPSASLEVRDSAPYVLDAQVGFRLRQAAQRHGAIFASRMGGDLTPRQWAALSKLAQTGPCAQNMLGRRTAMDAATIKGVVDRLATRGLLTAKADAADGRRRTIALTQAGQALVQECTAAAHAITRETLAPLDDEEQNLLLALLAKIG